MTATAEETGCQLSSKLHLWHRDLGCKHLEKVVLFFLVNKKDFHEFPFKTLFGSGLCFQERYYYRFSGEATETDDFVQGNIRQYSLFSLLYQINFNKLWQVTLCL